MKMMEELVSVIIPVFNVAHYLREAIESVIHQTYQNLEIIIIDDGSTDGSSSICDEYTENDPRVTVIHQNNRGLATARNIGIDHATGKYIAFLDSDDWMRRDTVGILLNSITANSADVAVCGCCQIFPDKNPDTSTPQIIQSSEGDQIIRDYLNGNGISDAVWNKLYRSDLFDAIHYPDGRDYEDASTTYKILDRANKLVGVPHRLIYYRARKGSISHSHSLKNLSDYWTSQKERNDALVGRFPDCKVELVSGCMDAAGRFWRWYYPERGKEKGLINEIQEFVRGHEKEVLGNREYSRLTRFSCFMTRYANPFVFFVLYYMVRVYNSIFRRQRLYD